MKWRMQKLNGALRSVAMKDADLNTERFLDAFDFTSVAERRRHAHKPLSLKPVMNIG